MTKETENKEIQKSPPPLPGTDQNQKQDQNQEQNQENPEKNENEEKISQGGDFFSPLAIVMFFFAALLDLFGFFSLFLDFFFGIGEIISPIFDVLGLVFIGSLMFVFSGTITKPSRPGKESGREPLPLPGAGSKILKKIGLSFLIELVPFLGNLVPAWTFAVWQHLKQN